MTSSNKYNNNNVLVSLPQYELPSSSRPYDEGAVRRYDPMYRNVTPSFIPIHDNNKNANTNKKEQQQYYDDIISLSKRTKMLKEILKDLGRHLPTTDSNNNIHTNYNRSDIKNTSS